MIYGVVKTSYVDYPNRLCTMIFIGGCNMRCPYCHNPEIVFKQSAMIDEKEVLLLLEKRRGVVDAVCISGGEPTLWKGLIDFIRKIKSMGFLIKLDTNGTNPSILSELLLQKLIDYVAIDIKSSKAGYHLASGVPIATDKIYESVEIVKRSGVEYEFRTTVHSSYVSKEDILKIADEISPARRYVLQGFVGRDQHVNNNALVGNKITSSDLEILRNTIISSGQIEHVLIR